MKENTGGTLPSQEDTSEVHASKRTKSVVMAALSLGTAVLIVVITLVWWLSNVAFVVNVAHDMGVSGNNEPEQTVRVYYLSRGCVQEVAIN